MVGTAPTMGQKKAKKHSKKKPDPAKKVLTAKSADRYVLYQESVQLPEHEVDLATSYFKKRYGRKPMSLREDFCGTALLCAEWVKSHADRTATGVDIDPQVLAWGREHNLAPLGASASRVALRQEDVRTVVTPEHDVVMALNYSYFYFKDRGTMRGYFENVRRGLADEGLFFLDLFGGWESVQVLREERKQKGFWYEWDQASFNPIDHHFLGYIHFRFPDGTKMRKAFTYDWRLWTIPELKEILHEAGFGRVDVLWEEEDADGEGTGVFKPRSIVDNDPGYNAYLLASVSG
ncbi:MAG: class I SAM-dependent methyltransferase [Sandaracinaceae bacterium]|nr:class I SAM-dependent methyltransferase [Sandaracinaceae bacterium]